MNISEEVRNSSSLNHRMKSINAGNISANNLSVDECKKISDVDWPNLKKVNLCM
jgi:hypothetical protein